MSPHIYAVAGAAYEEMIRESKNQVIKVLNFFESI